jgi:hypothetical protein
MRMRMRMRMRVRMTEDDDCTIPKSIDYCLARQ